jgi:DNA-binding MarR family transcriptional regulator
VLDSVRRIVQALRESSRAAETRVGMSGAQLFVLRVLADRPGLSLNELAERTRTHQSSVSTVVSRLVDEGLVERRTSAADRRRALLRVSSRGRQRLGRAPDAAQERLMDAVDALPPSDRTALASLLERVVANMALPRRRPAMFFEEAGKDRTTARERNRPD